MQKRLTPPLSVFLLISALALFSFAHVAFATNNAPAEHAYVHILPNQSDSTTYDMVWNTDDAPMGQEVQGSPFTVPDVISDQTRCPWYPYLSQAGESIIKRGKKSTIVNVNIEPDMKNYFPKNCAYWFCGLNNPLLTSIDGLDNLVTSECTSMNSMFATSSETVMFFTEKSNNGCLTLDLRSFDTSKVTDMSYMFYNVQDVESKLGTILFSDTFVTNNVVNMNYMFYGLSGLQELVFPGAFSFTSCDTAGFLFAYCKNLKRIVFPKDLSFENVYTYSIFDNCVSLQHIQFGDSGFNVGPTVINLFSTFYRCVNLTNLDLSQAQTDLMVNMEYIFYRDYFGFPICSALQTLDISSFNLPNIDYATDAFDSTSPETIYVTNGFVAKQGFSMPFALGQYTAYADRECTQKLGTYTFTQDGDINKAFELYPTAVCFQADADQVQPLVFDANGGTFDGATTYSVNSVLDGAITTAPYPTKPGYVFKGFTKDKAGTTPIDTTTPATAQSTPYAYAQWDKQDYTYTFKDTLHDSTLQFELPYEAELTSDSVPKPELDGDTFLYWQGSNGERITYDDEGMFSTTVGTDNCVFTAVWQSMTSDVVLDATPGAFADGSASKTYTEKINTYFDLNEQEEPSLAGFTFNGWQDEDGNSVEEYLVPDYTTTLHAVYKKVPEPTPDPEPEPTPDPSQNDGWVQDDTGWRYIQDGQYVVGWIWIDDAYGAHWYCFKQTTYMYESAWLWDDTTSAWYWCCSTGPMIAGLWQWIDNAWYGFWWNGVMCKGWIWDVDDSNWYFCYDNGVMAKDTWLDGYWLNNAGVWVH